MVAVTIGPKRSKARAERPGTITQPSLILPGAYEYTTQESGADMIGELGRMDGQAIDRMAVR